MPQQDATRDPRVYLAAERTFLAWIRTSLALMAFGFVVSRFGLFLRLLEGSHGESPSQPSSLSVPLGVALVLLGAIVDIFASWHHIRYIRAINQGLPTTGRPSTFAIVVALILALAGVVLAFYLGATAKSHQPTPSALDLSTHVPVRTASASSISAILSS